MSFVKKAVKKVFKVVKKVVKKTISFTKRVIKSPWFKIAAVIALSLFTAGIAAGGFAAFGSSMAAAGGGVGGFFTAVGSTIAQGFTAITGMVAKAGAGIKGMFGAANAGTAAGGFGAGTMGGTSFAAGATNVSLAGMLPAAAETAGLAASVTSGGGFLSTLGSLGSKLVPETTLGKLMMFQGISSGIQGYYKQKELDKQEGYYRNRTIWGKAAYGDTDDPIGIAMPTFDGPQIAAAGPEADPTTAVGAQEAGLLPFEQQQAAEEAAAMQQPQAPMMAQQAPQQGLLGVPGEMTQAPPATQPQDPNAPPPVPGSQLENLGVA